MGETDRPKTFSQSIGNHVLVMQLRFSCQLKTFNEREVNMKPMFQKYSILPYNNPGRMSNETKETNKSATELRSDLLSLFRGFGSFQSC